LLTVHRDTVGDLPHCRFRLYWTWKVRHGKAGRPSVPKATRELIRTMSRDNVLWGAPRIHSELLKLGIAVSQASVAKYMVRHSKPPSPRGEHFWQITCRKWFRSTSSPYILSGSRRCLSLSYPRTTADAFFIST